MLQNLQLPQKQLKKWLRELKSDRPSNPFWWSYVGIGGNVGFGGDSALGDGSFAIISKIGLTSNLSVRPTVLLRDNLTLLVPVTFDFVSQETVEVSEDFVISAAPYAGAGVIVTTGDDGNFGFLISGGVDVPLTTNLTATAGLNIGFVDGADVGSVSRCRLYVPEYCPLVLLFEQTHAQ